MNLSDINERLDKFKNFLSWHLHAKVNNAFGGNMRAGTFDQWLYSKHIDHLLTPDAEIIPQITNPLGKYWNQADQRRIYIDRENAYMEESEFNKLCNYSHSQPSGVYIGKCWKGKDINGWYLAWYGPHPNPDFVSNNYRTIHILPARNYRYEMDEKRTLTILS